VATGHRVEIVVEIDGQAHDGTMVRWCVGVKKYFSELAHGTIMVVVAISLPDLEG
jgi:hypothetical protein